MTSTDIDIFINTFFSFIDFSIVICKGLILLYFSLPFAIRDASLATVERR